MKENPHQLDLNFVDGRTLDLRQVGAISTSLANVLPQLKIKDYFEVKPEVILNSPFVVTATDAHNNVVAILAGKVLPCQARFFLNVSTLLIGFPYQGTRLFVQLWQRLFNAILHSYPAFIDAITLKTYNPVSMNLLLKIGKRAQTPVYPGLEALDNEEERFLDQMADLLEIQPNFDKIRGIVYDGAVGVPLDFYPKLPTITNPEISKMFAAPLSAKDRILGCIFLCKQAQKQLLLKQFNIFFDR